MALRLCIGRWMDAGDQGIYERLVGVLGQKGGLSGESELVVLAYGWKWEV
jgi:hypothetical protein